MSELPDGIEPAPIPEPKESSLGIVVRRRGDGAYDVLLGRRARSSRFMPGNLAFPGGRMEADDEPGRPGAFERCATREIAEETGLTIEARLWRDAGERTTPAFFPVRFRTKFFVAELPGGASLPPEPPQPQEIETLAFRDPAAVLDDWSAGRALVPPPLLPIFRMMVAREPRDAAALAGEIARINVAEDPNPRIEFEPGVWALPVRTRTLPPASCTNVWMPGGRRFVVIDPGSGEPEENARLLRVVRRRIAGGSEAAAVVLTHHHRDHVGGAGIIARELGVPVIAHAATLARTEPLPPGVATRAIADREPIDLDGMSLEAHHTPGHAPGHLAFFDAKRRVLIAGDLVSGLSTILIGLHGGDMETYLESLRRMAALAPRTVLPSHGPPLPGASLAATIAHREEREAKVAAALGRSPRAIADIAAEAYADSPQAPAFLREMQTRAHLEHLARRGAAVAAGPEGSSWRR